MTTADMTHIGRALTDASRLCHPLTEARFAVAYGSHVRRTAVDSDLDLLFVGDAPLGRERTAWLTTQVQRLHHRHGLRLDEEVSYEVKLYATRDEVADAVSFGGYDIDGAGRLTIPPVVADPAYLNSAAFKARLIVNALTSSHVFLGGDVRLYRSYRAQAVRTVALIALALLEDVDPVNVTDAVAALIGNAGGMTGEDFLGYTQTDQPYLYGLLQAGFADLAARQVLRPRDGATFHHDRGACRALLRRMAQRPPVSSGMGRLPSTAGG